MYELSQPHVIIELPKYKLKRITDEFIEFYKKGLSLRDIAKETGKAKSTVRKKLIQAGIELRPKVMLSTITAWRTRRKGSRPCYGFCFYQGLLVADQKEYPVLLRIHSLWRGGGKPTSITNDLNSKKLPARGAPVWRRGSVGRIINRFENKSISIKGDQYELR